MVSSTTSPEFSQKIKQVDHKFSSKLVSKDTTNPSFRVYYGNVSGAIPFTWEIQPGTPKHNFSDNSLIPPLTPPPAYYFSNPHHQTKPTKRKYFPRSNLLYNLLFNIKKGHVASSSSPSTSLSSSSWSSLTSSSVSSSSKGSRIKRRRFASFGSSIDDGYMDDGGSPDSVVCFGMNSKKNSNNGGGGTCAVVIMKKAFLSIVGRRSV